MDLRKAEKRKCMGLMFELESGAEEQSAENNKNERKWKKKIRKRKSKC